MSTVRKTTGRARERDLELVREFGDNAPAGARSERIAEHYAAYALAGETGGEWRPLGPDTVEHGQASTDPRPKVSGRVNAIALAGEEVFVATSNGGVWRSEDRGRSWRPTMRAQPKNSFFDEDPEYLEAADRLHVDSLACGAVACLDGRLYVGTGEGYSFIDAFRGVGPVFASRQDRETGRWRREHAHEDSPPLEGEGFYRIAAAPPAGSAESPKVFAATSAGLYERKRDPEADKPRWYHQPLASEARPEPAKAATDVVTATKNGRRVFYAAMYGGPVYRWDSADASDSRHWDEVRWKKIGGSFPGGAFSAEGRVSLAVNDADPDLVYALTATGGVYRLHAGGGGAWTKVLGPAGYSPGKEGTWNDQGDYNLAIALDPRSPAGVERFYVGMARVEVDDEWCAALYRCDHDTTGNAKASVTHIGRSLHPDVHSLEFDEHGVLWVGCDGGVFHAARTSTGEPDGPPGDKHFVSCNDGLQTLGIYAFGQSPTHEDRIYCGCQDNGCLEYRPSPPASGETAEARHVWKAIHGGDAGAVLVHDEKEPAELIVAVAESDNKKKLAKRLSSGVFHDTFAGDINELDSEFNTVELAAERMPTYLPLASAADASTLIATGAQHVWISEDFGSSWKRAEGDAHGQIHSLAFAGKTRLYAGTSIQDVFDDRAVYRGNVRRFDKNGDIWQEIPLPDLPHPAPVTGIAVAGDSIYVTVGGAHDYLFQFDKKDREILAALKDEWPKDDPWLPALAGGTTVSPVGDSGTLWRVTEPAGGRVLELREKKDEHGKVEFVVTLASEDGLPQAFHLPRVYHYDGTKWEPRSGERPPLASNVAAGVEEIAGLDRGVVPARLESELGLDDSGDARAKALVSVVVRAYRWHIFDPRDGGRLFDVRARGGRFVVLRETPRLLFVHHSAIVADPADPADPADHDTLYAAADIGVWRSPDAGRKWYPFSCGLPDASVMDLKFFPPTKEPTDEASEPGKTDGKPRRLRAATHGRGLFECFSRPHEVVDVLCVVDGRTLLYGHPERAVIVHMVTRHAHNIFGGLVTLDGSVDEPVLQVTPGTRVRWRAVSLTADEKVEALIANLALVETDGAADTPRVCRRPVCHSCERDLWETETLAPGTAAYEVRCVIYDKETSSGDDFAWRARLDVVPSLGAEHATPADPIMTMGSDHEVIDILCVVDGKGLFQYRTEDADREVGLGSGAILQRYCRMVTRSDDCLGHDNEANLEIGAWTGQRIRWRAVSMTGDKEYKVTIKGFYSQAPELYTGPELVGDDIWESTTRRPGRDNYYLIFTVEHGGKTRRFNWDPVITIR